MKLETLKNELGVMADAETVEKNEEGVYIIDPEYWYSKEGRKKLRRVEPYLFGNGSTCSLRTKRYQKKDIISEEVTYKTIISYLFRMYGMKRPERIISVWLHWLYN